MEKKPIKNKEKFFNHAFKIQIVMIDEINFFKHNSQKWFHQIKIQNLRYPQHLRENFNNGIKVE